MFRYVVVEYCFADDSTTGEKHELGAYPSKYEARKAAGQYIKDNVKRMKKRYRHWQVEVHKERIFWEIRGLNP